MSRGRAVVVGAGPAGAASAISLARHGFQVDVLEVSPTYALHAPCMYVYMNPTYALHMVHNMYLRSGWRAGWLHSDDEALCRLHEALKWPSGAYLEPRIS